MMKNDELHKEDILEILISTMNRTSFSFLKKMFPNHELDDYKILIVNQTKHGIELVSERANIRVINSYETGLCKSRNLAIENAIGDICLIADDDVEFEKDFQLTILKAFNIITDASIIKFRIDTFTGEEYKTYPKDSKRINSKNGIRSSSSIEIAFRRNDIINSNIFFNTNFGLGSCFPSGEEYLFLKESLQKGLLIYFENKTIVMHSLERSTSNVGEDNFIMTKSAIYYKDYKFFAYLFLLKFIFFLVRKKNIPFKLAFSKFKVGLEAIAAIKKLNK